MKKIYFSILIALSFVSTLVNAQCTGCTTNITGLNASNHVISSGQTMCISSTGTVTGLITVSAGGTLCNQGKINSSNVWIAGGTLKNYGTIDTYSLMVSSAGTFTNYSTALIDSLLITNSNSSYINNGTQTSSAFTTSDHASTVNSGTITVYNMLDSVATFDNWGTITVTNDFANAYSSVFKNYANITVNRDFANLNGADFTNNIYMRVMRDFYNSASNFLVKCMMNVGRDWYNTGYIQGAPMSTCGGFNITGLSYNSGQLGITITHLDICDAGNPAGGLDGNTGTIHPTTTFCSCSNSCSATTVGIKEIAQSNLFITSVYPNPATTAIKIKFNSIEAEITTLEVLDILGKNIFTKSAKTQVGENELELTISDLSQGIYILSITDSKNLQTKQLFTVSK